MFWIRMHVRLSEHKSSNDKYPQITSMQSSFTSRNSVWSVNEPVSSTSSSSLPLVRIHFDWTSATSDGDEDDENDACDSADDVEGKLFSSLEARFRLDDFMIHIQTYTRTPARTVIMQFETTRVFFHSIQTVFICLFVGWPLIYYDKYQTESQHSIKTKIWLKCDFDMCRVGQATRLETQLFLCHRAAILTFILTYANT